MKQIVIFSVLLAVILIVMCSFQYMGNLNNEEEQSEEKASKKLPPSEDASQDAVFYDDSDFQKMPEPKRGEWLAEHPEDGQTFEEYINSEPLTPTQERSKIILQPIGDFNEEQKELLDKLKEFCGIYFGLTIETAPAIPLPETKKYKRTREWGGKTWVQYRTDYLLDKVLRPRLPPDAFCYLGITMADLYPEDSWNYVFGQAMLSGRVGVYSLVRYFPEFWGEKNSEDNKIRALLRSCKTLSHETGHMFGMKHCIFYSCNISGSNSLEESDRQPIHLCPVCLRKLQWNIKFDVIKRYEQLEKFYRDNKLVAEADWVKKRLEKIKATLNK